ncbi:DUF397 domain-containing protein [Streptomyces rhizosphaerihabitans]|uniref:DUF397 domain-containing protein n=1 Tax=Streptomyces rhizosphaerihabitans TaxID=1266770 RepID=UPI0037042EC3
MGDTREGGHRADGELVGGQSGLAGGQSGRDGARRQVRRGGPVRDSKNPLGPVITLGAAAWGTFVGHLGATG